MIEMQNKQNLNNIGSVGIKSKEVLNEIPTDTI
jgi:hypothetical protein